MAGDILLIEDDAGLVLTLTDRLGAEGYEVRVARDGEKGVAAACDAAADLIVLDVMLPGRSGFDVCRDLRHHGIDTPILMLTARGEVADKVVGLKLGADDYLTKPFEMIELLARIEALLRRTGQLPPPASNAGYRFGAIFVDFAAMEVRRDDEPVQMTAREFQLLRFLIERRGKLLSREEILNNVWGYTAMPNSRTIDTHIAWLRQKLEPNPRHPQYILTLHGLGYKFKG